MKSRLVIGEHAILKDAQVIEVWDDSVQDMVAAVYGRDGAGVRVISKYPIEVIQGTDGQINVVEVIIG